MDKLNSSIGQDPESKNLIGVLDIYGFESFKTNRCFAGTPFVCKITRAEFLQFKLQDFVQSLSGINGSLLPTIYSILYVLHE